MPLTRYCGTVQDAAAGASAAASDPIDCRQWAGGMIHVPAGSEITTITWYCSTEKDGTFLAVMDGAGEAVTTTIAAGQACLIPAACFAAAWLKAVGNAAGTIDISLKG